MERSKGVESSEAQSYRRRFQKWCEPHKSSSQVSCKIQSDSRDSINCQGWQYFLHSLWKIVATSKDFLPEAHLKRRHENAWACSQAPWSILISRWRMVSYFPLLSPNADLFIQFREEALINCSTVQLVSVQMWRKGPKCVCLWRLLSEASVLRWRPPWTNRAW